MKYFLMEATGLISRSSYLFRLHVTFYKFLSFRSTNWVTFITFHAIAEFVLFVLHRIHSYIKLFFSLSFILLICLHKENIFIVTQQFILSLDIQIESCAFNFPFHIALKSWNFFFLFLKFILVMLLTILYKLKGFA